jgi:hypothetical protein
LTSDAVFPTFGAGQGFRSTNNNRHLETSVEHSTQKLDVVLLSDMTRGGDIGLRIRREVQALAGRGYGVGLRHLPVSNGAEISPDIQRCVREGLARPLGSSETVIARLAIAHAPSTVTAPVSLGGLTAEHVVLVIDDVPTPQQMGYWFGLAIGPMTWVPTNRWVRAGLERLGFPVPIAEEDWRAIAAPCRPRPGMAPVRVAPVVGWVGTVSDIPRQDPDGGAGFDIWVHDAASALPDLADTTDPPDPSGPETAGSVPLTVIDPGDMALERFVEAADILICAPGIAAVPEASIVAAMASGKPVILPHRVSGPISARLPSMPSP